MDNGCKQRLLHYDTIEKLGKGGSGQVHKAWDTERQRMVALKLLKPQLTETVAFRAHCLTAVNRLSGCRHPNICSVFGIHQVDESHLIVTEYLEGVTLRELIKRGPLDNHTFLNIAAQIADGLKFAHERLVTHGNIKPSNVMVTSDGQVKIMGFGLACFHDTDEDKGVEPSLETLSYFAPEQITTEPVTQLADFFSLGALFYELLTGRRPFTGDTRETIETSILHDKPDFQTLRAKKIPGDTILMIEKLLAKNPLERFSSAGELSITLQAMRSFEQESVTRKSLQVKPRTARQYLFISLLAFLLVVLWYVVTTYRN